MTAPFEFKTTGADQSKTESLEAQKLSHMALLLRDAGHHEAALSLVKRAASLAPTDGKVLGNLANILITSHNPHLAVTLTRKAMQLSPEIRFPLGHNLGLALMYAGDYVGALEELSKAAERWVDAAFDKGCVLLLTGQWDKGWPAMEVRRERAKTEHPQHLMPEWDGQKFNGTLWVTVEQGHGDVFNFARYLTWARQQCDRVVFSCYAQLMPFFYDFPGVDEVRLWDSSVPEPEATFHVPLLSLPLFHGTRLHNVPKDPQWFKHIAMSLKPSLKDHPEGKLKVGICWAGSKQHPRDFERSIPLEQMLPIVENPDVIGYSFQVGPRSKDLEMLGSSGLISDFSDKLVNWVATAAALTQMDVLVTVDTGIAHLAGCLGIPTWLLLCKNPDWRWLLKRHDTPWYPSVELFRQHKLGEWDYPIKKVCDKLHELSQRTKATKERGSAS